MDGLVFENPDLNNEACDDQQKVSQQDAIDFSNFLVGFFEDICDEEQGISISDLKKVYRQAGVDCERDKCSDINLWAIAKVNMYVRMKSKKEIKQNIKKTKASSTNKITALELESPLFYENLQSVNIAETWVPSKEDFQLADQYIKKYDLKFTFSSVNDLYIEEYKPLELELE
jgi:hypothetical protein